MVADVTTPDGIAHLRRGLVIAISAPTPYWRPPEGTPAGGSSEVLTVRRVYLKGGGTITVLDVPANIDPILRAMKAGRK